MWSPAESTRSEMRFNPIPRSATMVRPLARGRRGRGAIRMKENAESASLFSSCAAAMGPPPCQTGLLYRISADVGLLVDLPGLGHDIARHRRELADDALGLLAGQGEHRKVLLLHVGSEGLVL